MTPHPLRIALATPRFPKTPDDSVQLAEQAIAAAAAGGAAIVCFPECFVPGYRVPGRPAPPPSATFLAAAHQAVATAAARADLAVVLGTERIEGQALYATALVIDRDGTPLGFQDKVQLDPSEDGHYHAGTERHVFRLGDVAVGVTICHEGWRYPETVRWPSRHGAQLVFHQQFHEAEPGAFRPTTFCDPRNTFHEKALLCRAAENTVYVASANYASEGSPTTSAVVSPDGAVLAWQPYGVEGVLFADLELSRATGLLARRLKPLP